MKKLLLSIICAAVALGACNTYSEKNYKKYKGISYEQYEDIRKEQQAETKQVPIVPPVPSVVQEEEIETAQPVGMEDLTGTDNEVVESTNSTYGEAVVVMASKKIPLGENASYSDMQNFQTALDAAYNTARRTYHATGFTYAISPAGPVNPLSEMDVQCILSESLANATGKAACDLFFKQIPLEYNKGNNDTAL
jgi:hypothetical protein